MRGNRNNCCLSVLLESQAKGFCLEVFGKGFTEEVIFQLGLKKKRGILEKN